MEAETFYEITVPEGLESLAYDELRSRLGSPIQLLHPLARFPGTIQFHYEGKPEKLLQLRAVLSLFWGRRFAVPRPRALLGHQYFSELLQRVEEIRRYSPKGAYQTLYLAAAGSESSVMQRFTDELAAAAKLRVVRDEGDLLVRVRPPLDGSPGWETLIRMAPRPLSTRKYRVCDLEGALNAAVAYCAAMLSAPQKEDVFLNLGCGSGTLLIERAAHSPSRRLVGCDTNPAALDCARANIAAAGNERRIQVYPWDARALPLEPGSVDVVVSDLPFGLDVGSHDANLELYPALLSETARVTRAGGRCVFITQEVRLLGSLLEQSPDWAVERIQPVTITGLRPRIYVLKRSPG